MKYTLIKFNIGRFPTLLLVTDIRDNEMINYDSLGTVIKIFKNSTTTIKAGNGVNFNSSEIIATADEMDDLTEHVMLEIL